MPLTDYIGKNEKIHLSFRKGVWYFVLTTGAVMVFFGGLAYFFWGTIVFYPTVAIMALTLLYMTIRYLYTIYFVTGRYAYKIKGFLRKKLTSVRKQEVENIVVSQGAFERFVFDTGTIRINVKRSPRQSQLTLSRIQDPDGKIRAIKNAWRME